MSGPRATDETVLTERQHQALKQLRRRQQLLQRLYWRVLVILLTAKGYANSQITRLTGKSREWVALMQARNVIHLLILNAADFALLHRNHLSPAH